MPEQRRVLRFSDGSAKFADPANYVSPTALAALAPGSNLHPAIVRAYQTALAAAISTAAAKSAASGRGPR